MNGRKVPVTVHFGVQGGKQPARAVVMDDKIVQAQNLRGLHDAPADLFDQFGVGRAAQQGVNGILHGAQSGIQDEQRDQNPQITVQLQVKEVTGKGADKNHGSGGHIAQAVGGSGHHGGGIQLFAELPVKQAHPALDQNGDRQDDTGNPGKFRRHGMQDLFKGGLAQLKSHQQDDDRNGQPGKVFNAPVAKGVVAVRLLPRQAEADEGDDGRTGVGQVIEGVGGDGNGSGNGTRNELADKQQHIQADADQPAQRTVLLPYGGVLHIFSVPDKQPGK